MFNELHAYRLDCLCVCVCARACFIMLIGHWVSPATLTQLWHVVLVNMLCPLSIDLLAYNQSRKLLLCSSSQVRNRLEGSLSIQRQYAHNWTLK